jgi:hypothetical protein
VYCEGKVTERGYINDLARHVRATSVTVASEHGDPKYLVERAAAQKKATKSADPKDSIWCVFDADDHLRLAEALKQAKDNGIPVALSNPCFELWVLLHYDDHRAYIERAALRAKVKTHLPKYDKAVPFAELHPSCDQASARAVALHDMHEGNGSVRHENPSTSVWELVEAIVRLGRSG